MRESRLDSVNAERGGREQAPTSVIIVLAPKFEPSHKNQFEMARHRKLGNEKNNYAPKVQIQRDATVPEMALCSLVPMLYSSTRPYTNQCSKKQPDFPIFERKMASTGPSSLLACAERTAGSTRSACPPTNHGGLGGPQATIRTRNVP